MTVLPESLGSSPTLLSSVGSTPSAAISPADLAIHSRSSKVAAHVHVGRPDPLIHRRCGKPSTTGDHHDLDREIVDAIDDHALSDVTVSTHGALAHTDPRGGFTLNFSPHIRPFVQVYCEARGYALSEIVIPLDDMPVKNFRMIHMHKEKPVEGQVLDPDGHPIAGGRVELWTERRLINRETLHKSDHANAIVIVGISDNEGKFAIHGLPELVPVCGRATGIHRVHHPSFATFNADGRSLVPLNAGGPTRITMQPGCSVAGVVVDEQGL